MVVNTASTRYRGRVLVGIELSCKPKKTLTLTLTQTLIPDVHSVDFGAAALVRCLAVVWRVRGRDQRL